MRVRNDILTSFPVVLSHDHRKTIEKLYLSGQHLGPRELDIEPFRAVDFGKALPSTGSGGHSTSKVLLISAAGSKMALAGECDNALAPSLSDLPQWLEWTN